MIVRILGEGQFRVDDDAALKLTALDKDLDAAVRDDTEAAFHAALHAAVAVRVATLAQRLIAGAIHGLAAPLLVLKALAPALMK